MAESGIFYQDASDPGIDEVNSVGKTVIICLGNRYLKDDGLAIQVADELNERSLGGNVLLDVCQTMDLSLLGRHRHASKIIVVDAMKGGAPPGTISKWTIARREAPLTALPGLHGMELHDLFDLASEAGLLTCPVTIIGVEPKDCRVGEGLSAELMSAVPSVIAEVERELGR